MPSTAFSHWSTFAKANLDQIEAAHGALGGTGRGRRYATLQVNHAYAVLVSSQFQGFCRDLHSEAVDFLAASVTPPSLGTVVRSLMIQGRKLDQGNPNAGNIGSDFGRIGLDLWPQVKRIDRFAVNRQKNLEYLNTWRNAIAHQDWTKVGTNNIRLKQVQVWRAACGGLAASFDRVVGAHLQSLVGRAPW